MLFIISFSAMTEEKQVFTRFNISPFIGSSHIYDNAQTVRDLVEDVLYEMGACKVCNKSNLFRAGTVERCNLKGNHGCYLMREVFDDLQEYFTVQKITMKPCSSYSHAYKISF